MKNSKKLLAAVAALVVALAVSVGSTFAWFTTNKYATVENIQATVTTGDATLEVAFVWENATIGDNNRKEGEIGQFGYNINLGDAMYLGNILKHTEWDALTDKGNYTKESSSWEGPGQGENGNHLTDKKGEDATWAKYTAAEEEGEDGTWKTGNYLTFTLRFRTAATDENKSKQGSGIKLNLSVTNDETSKSFVKSNKTEGKYPDIWGWDWFTETTNNWVTNFGEAKAKELGEGHKYEANAQDAVRVAFHEADVKSPVTTDEGTTPGSVSVKKGTDSKANTGKVWNPHAGEAWSTATYNKNMAQVIEERLTSVTADSLNTLYADPKYTDVKDSEYEVVTLKYNEKAGYFIGDVKFFIWIEGTDADCFNNIFGDLVKIQLGFELEQFKSN